MSTLKAKGCLFLASSLCDGLEDNDIKQVTTLLLNKEANPNTLIPTYGVTPFHLVIGNDSEAFAEEVTKLFLRHGGNPNVRSAEGLTPVHVAAAWGRITVLELLLANGGDPLCLDDEGRSPFHYAFDGKYYKAIVVLGKYCDNSIKEEKAANYKMTFNKLLINSGDIVAEYTAPQFSDVIKDNELNEKGFKGHRDLKYANAFNFSDDNADNDDRLDISAAELQIREEMNKEKCLVNEIINQLSHSLKSSSREQETTKDDYESSKKSLYDTSPSSTMSTDSSSMVYSMRDKFSQRLKARKRSVTPKYKPQIFGQDKNNVGIPLIPVYDPYDSIISKSPNFLTNKTVEKKQKYLSPKMLNKEMKFKAFTPCMTRNQSFRSDEFDLGKEMARSTPRRRKRFYRQYSSHRKLNKNDGLSSPENTSPDSTNSLSPEQHNCMKKLNYKFDKTLAIKLHENKYDDDIISVNDNKNEDYAEKCILRKGLNVEELSEDFENLNMEKANSKRRNKENLKDILWKRFPNEEERMKEDLKDTDGTVNTFKENLNTFLSSFKSTATYISVQEEYKYEDTDEGVVFLERRIYTLPPCKTTDHNCTSSTDKMWPSSLNLSVNISGLTDEALRKRLIKLGDKPGPITHTTRQLYLNRLIKLENGAHILSSSFRINHQKSSLMDCCEFQIRSFLKYGEWMNDLRRYKIIEKNTFKEFTLASPSRRWREGMSKTCFNYLLLDPRVTKDLPSRAENLTKSALWVTFLSAIFYVGKGTRNRPYSHLKDAFEMWVSHQNSENGKIQTILNIWNSGHGVVCLHVFQNSIPVEAYTREAAIIDALGTQKLKNHKVGDYYGIAATWNVEEKRNFGRYLLYQAMQIFLHEGETQIFPQNV